jgi:hypothetical protein
MATVRDRWESIRWQLTVFGWRIHAHALPLTLVVVAAGLLVAMTVEPAWSLRFERALAWPVVALVGIFLFRRPFAGLLQSRGLRGFSSAPGRISGELEAEDQVGSTGPPQADTREELQAGFIALGQLVQLYQFQIDFLKQLGQTAYGLTIDATHEWFRTALMARGLERWDVEQLIFFLLDRGLVALNEGGNYSLTPMGYDFLNRINGFWHAPKAI